VDGTTVQGPASKGIEWRLHFAIDLQTLNCDWYELTDAHGGELLDRTPVHAGDVLLADRNFLRPVSVGVVTQAGGHVLVRLRWRHPALQDPEGRPFVALDRARSLRVGEVGTWPVLLPVPEADSVPGRVIATRMPGPVGARAARRAERIAAKQGRRIDPRSVEAAHLIMVFTTLSDAQLATPDVLELYRCRWQIELTFKRLKQLLKLGRLPHKDPRAARSWILAKLVVALLLETLYRQAATLSPWGYSLPNLAPLPA
jgi:hypothetical protein